MNTQPCCIACATEETGKCFTNFRCSCHLGQDWKNALPMVGNEFCQGHLNDLEKAINSLLAEQKKAAYAEAGESAAREIDKAVDKAVNIGRKEVLNEILAQWPKEEIDRGSYTPMSQQAVRSFNEGVAAGKAVVEELKNSI